MDLCSLRLLLHVSPPLLPSSPLFLLVLLLVVILCSLQKDLQRAADLLERFLLK